MLPCGFVRIMSLRLLSYYNYNMGYSKYVCYNVLYRNENTRKAFKITIFFPPCPAQFSQIMGLESILGTTDLWPILLALTALPAVFQLVTLPICPESPKYLLINKEEAISAQRGELVAKFLYL